MFRRAAGHRAGRGRVGLFHADVRPLSPPPTTPRSVASLPSLPSFLPSTIPTPHHYIPANNLWPENSLFLFLLFYPHATPPTAPKHPSPQPSYRTALLVTITCILHFLAIFTASLLIATLAPARLQVWANALGVLATVLASIQYLPQLYTTFRLKKVGSLSIPMMCIQTPGSFVWAGSLAARVGTEGWSAWGVYVVTGCLQGVLLGMGVYFEVGERRRRVLGEGVGNGDAGGEGRGEGLDGENGDPGHERTPLLREGG